MTEFWLRVRAPFAAFRWMQAGVYRATSPVIPPSAAWGLVLNLAHVETRGPTDGVVTTTRGDAPTLGIAVGQMSDPHVATLYQQLHSYPVGSSGKELATRSHGSKYWIKPVRREILVGFDCVVGVRSEDAELPDRIRAGLDGSLDVPRYGLPFAGDNNLLLDRVELLDSAPEARWFVLVGDGDGATTDTCRLTIAIDRVDSSKTRVGLFRRLNHAAAQIPAPAWNRVPGPAA